MSTYHLNCFLTPSQGEAIISLKEQSGLNLSELTRRMFDYCLQEHRLNELIPSMSGRMLKDVKG
jgi:hypothetical protein